MLKVVQCWDDGIINDARLADLLHKYNAKATFNLNPGLMKSERIPSYWQTANGPIGWYHGYHPGYLGLSEIKEVFAGFEVASHCYRHEDASKTPLPEFLKSALDARHFLEDMFQRPCLGFAWPYGTYTPEALDALRDAGFAYGRTVKNVENVSNFEHHLALHPNCHYQDAAFYQKYQTAKTNGSKFFYFWGHSYEMLDYDKLWEQFEMKLKMITDDPDAEWANVIDIVR